MRLPQHRVLPLLIGFAFAAGCTNRADIEELKKNQKDILAKLDKVQSGAARQPPKRPPGPDPKQTYAFPVEHSPIKGPKEAWVTLIEVSDFQ